jgi:succinoglycan biosynthesis protein ExoM
MLRRCVASLVAQQRKDQPFRYLIIVVENDAHEQCAPIVRGVFPDDSHLYLSEPRLGIPVARNRGLDAALELGADLVAFIDDDEIAPQGWLEAMFATIQASNADVVQGGVRQISTAAIGSIPEISFSTELTWRSADTAATSNTLMRVWPVLAPHNLRFDEEMRFTGGSDTEFFMRVHLAGARIVRAKGVDVVEERVPERETLRYRLTRSFASGGNYCARVRKNCPSATAVRRIAGRILGGGVNGVWRVLWGSLRWPVSPRKGGAIVTAGCLNLAFTAGCLACMFGVRATPYLEVTGA